MIFSLLLPGFGIARGGCLGRAVAWFLGLELGAVIVGLGLALEEIGRHFGCVPSLNVYGKVTAIYYPFSRAGRPRYPSDPVGDATGSQPSRVETYSTPGAAGPRP